MNFLKFLLKVNGNTCLLTQNEEVIYEDLNYYVYLLQQNFHDTPDRCYDAALLQMILHCYDLLLSSYYTRYRCCLFITCSRGITQRQWTVASCHRAPRKAKLLKKRV